MYAIVIHSHIKMNNYLEIIKYATTGRYIIRNPTNSKSMKVYEN